MSRQAGFNEAGICLQAGCYPPKRSFILVSRIIVAVTMSILAVQMLGCTAEEKENSPSAKVPLPGLGIRLGVEPIAPIVPAYSEGKNQLLYELAVSGFDPRSLSIDSLEIFGASEDTVSLAKYGNSELRRIMRSPGRNNPLLIDPGSSSVVFVAIESDDRVPEFIYHKLWLQYESVDGPVVEELTTNPILLQDIPVLTLNPPVRGGFWYAHAGPADISHHRTTLAPRGGELTMDQRFAIDWLKLNGSSLGGSLEIAGPDWEGTLGSEVVAVADGTVAAVQKGVPDEPIGDLGASGTWIDWDTIGGNRVVIDLGEGRYAWYHHLKEGSITIREGDRVSSGQVLGRIGNSGQTSHPHLHFEVTDSSILGLGNGLPYRLRCFTLLDRIDPMPDWTDVAESDPVEIGLTGPLPQLKTSSVRLEEIPLGGAVVTFPETPGAGCAVAEG